MYPILQMHPNLLKSSSECWKAFILLPVKAIYSLLSLWLWANSLKKKLKEATSGSQSKVIVYCGRESMVAHLGDEKSERWMLVLAIQGGTPSLVKGQAMPQGVSVGESKSSQVDNKMLLCIRPYTVLVHTCTHSCWLWRGVALLGIRHSF